MNRSSPFQAKPKQSKKTELIVSLRIFIIAYIFWQLVADEATATEPKLGNPIDRKDAVERLAKTCKEAKNSACYRSQRIDADSR